MVSIALVDARKTSLTGVQNSTKKIGSPLRGLDIKIAKKIGSPLRGSDIKIATKKIGSPLRGSDIKIATKKNRLAASRLVDVGSNPPPLGKKLDPPLHIQSKQ